MRIPAGKTEVILALACCFCSGAELSAQTEPTEAEAPTAPEAGGPAPSAATADPAPKSTPAATGDTAVAPTASAALDYFYNRKAQEGTAAKEAENIGGRVRDRAIAADALGVERIADPLLRARFEKYLALPPVPEAQIAAYEASYQRVLALLQERKAFDAWRELFNLAEFSSIDAGVSRELANRIESIWNADRASTGLASRNDRLRDEIRGTNRNADLLADSVREKDIEYQRKLSLNRQGGRKPAQNQAGDHPAPPAGDNKAGGITGSPSIDSVIGKLQLTDAYLQTIEARARIKLNELKTEKLFEDAKANFASYISALFDSGRARHVILAADFYRRIFDASEYPAAMAQQVNAALEQAREVGSAVEVVRYKADGDEIAAAASQLQQAFVGNEFHPALLGLDRSYKSKVESFFSTLDRMQNLIEAREFTDLEELLGQMKKTAADFDGTKIKAMVNAVKLEGQLRLGKAKLAAQQGDLTKAMEEFQAAAEVWPSNPDLQDKALTFFDSQDIQSQSLREFDRMVEEGNYRGIFDKQLAFAPAMKDDKARQEQLKEALEKVKLAEIAIEKANLMRASGDVFGAWETVELAVANLPNDIKLNTLRGDLSGRGAEFVAAINRAKEAEARQEFGYSLTWYAIAQRYYPASRIANSAIQHLSEKLL